LIEKNNKTASLFTFSLLSIIKIKEATSNNNGGHRTAQSGLSNTHLPAMSSSRSARQQH
jgi:hypothetical protein